MATHYSILAWRSPWTVEPWGSKELDMIFTFRGEIIFETSCHLFKFCHIAIKILIFFIAYNNLFDI